MNRLPYIAINIILNFLNNKNILNFRLLNKWWNLFFYRETCDIKSNDIFDLWIKNKAYISNYMSYRGCWLCGMHGSLNNRIRCINCGEYETYEMRDILKDRKNIYKINICRPYSVNITDIKKNLNLTCYNVIYPNVQKQLKYKDIIKIKQIIYNCILSKIIKFNHDISLTVDDVSVKYKKIFDRLRKISKHNGVATETWLSDNEYNVIHIQYEQRSFSLDNMINDITLPKMINLSLVTSIINLKYDQIEIITTIYIKKNKNKKFDFLYKHPQMGIFTPRAHHLINKLYIYLYKQQQYFILSPSIMDELNGYIDLKFRSIFYHEKGFVYLCNGIFEAFSYIMRMYPYNIIIGSKNYIIIRIAHRIISSSQVVYKQIVFDYHGYIVDDDKYCIYKKETISNKKDKLKKHIVSKKRIIRVCYNMCANYKRITANVYNIKQFPYMFKIMK